jgi:hypothetical protein
MNPRIWRPVGGPHVIFEEEHEGGVVRQGLEVFLLVNLKPKLLRHGIMPPFFWGGGVNRK